MEEANTPPEEPTIDRELVVQNKMGIHARPAAMVVRLTSKFKGEVFFEKDDEQVNGKSIMGLMMLAAGRGSKIRVIVRGAGGDQLVKELQTLFERRFDES